MTGNRSKERQINNNSLVFVLGLVSEYFPFFLKLFLLATGKKHNQ